MGAFPGLVLPLGPDDVDRQFMTQLLRHSGLLTATDEVVSQEESDVGLTAGYLSAIKKVTCTYREATGAKRSFVVKTWPLFELLPKETLRALFVKDIGAYSLPAESFYPRPKTYLAGIDPAGDRCALVMEDADTFAEHKVHEQEMDLGDVMRMLPKLVDVAVAWEGCDTGAKARRLAEFGVDLWASEANLAFYKSVMPGGAKLFDKLTTLEDSVLMGGRPWDKRLGGRGICEMFTKRLDGLFDRVQPQRGATCTLSHGDLRGDNIFFCDNQSDYSDGWLCIDFQQMFRGPVPSDLAYLMSTGSVLTEVYTGPNLHAVLRAFYEQFMMKTQVYKGYTFDMFVEEYAKMTTVHFMYAVGIGGAVWRGAAFDNLRAARVELGGQGATEADLTPEELRQRMWWRKAIANYGANFKTFGHYEYLKTLPEDLGGLGTWAELPEHLL